MITINWSKSHRNDFEPQKNFDRHQHSSRNIFARLGHIIKRLKTVGNSWAKLSNYAEPKIWDRKNSDGNIYYRVYDPKSDRYHYFNSENEVRWWLDKRYYL